MELFADRRKPEKEVPSQKKDVCQNKTWNVLLVDDDSQMHQVTKLALSGFEFQGTRS